MNLSKIIELWDLDCQIDYTDIGSEAIKIPSLHNKYLKLLTAEKIILKSLEKDFSIRKHEIFEIYKFGPQKPEDNIHLPPDGKQTLRADFDRNLEGNKELNEMSFKIAQQLEKVKYLEEIIRSLNNRNFIIKNYIDWKKFVNGQ